MPTRSPLFAVNYHILEPASWRVLRTPTGQNRTRSRTAQIRRNYRGERKKNVDPSPTIHGIVELNGLIFVILSSLMRNDLSFGIIDQGTQTVAYQWSCTFLPNVWIQHITSKRESQIAEWILSFLNEQYIYSNPAWSKGWQLGSIPRRTGNFFFSFLCSPNLIQATQFSSFIEMFYCQGFGHSPVPISFPHLNILPQFQTWHHTYEQTKFPIK